MGAREDSTTKIVKRPFDVRSFYSLSFQTCQQPAVERTVIYLVASYLGWGTEPKRTPIGLDSLTIGLFWRIEKSSAHQGAPGKRRIKLTLLRLFSSVLATARRLLPPFGEKIA